jgi:hypothetical protein
LSSQQLTLEISGNTFLLTFNLQSNSFFDKKGSVPAAGYSNDCLDVWHPSRKDLKEEK